MDKNIEIKFKVTPEVNQSGLDDLKKKLGQDIKIGVTIDDSKTKNTAKNFSDIADNARKIDDNIKVTNDSLEDMGATAEKTGSKFNFVEKLATFGLVADGIGALSDSINQISEPFMKLDTATHTQYKQLIII